MTGLNGVELDMVIGMVKLVTASVAIGGILGGFSFSLTVKVWTHIADRMAEKLDAHRAEKLLRLQAECWRLRAARGR